MIAIEIPKEKLREFCRKWKVTELALFGSVTRPEEFRPDSDVDVLVRFADGERWALFEFVDMQAELASIFERKVDLLTRPGVEQMRNYLRREDILSSAVLLEVA